MLPQSPVGCSCCSRPCRCAIAFAAGGKHNMERQPISRRPGTRPVQVEVTEVVYARLRAWAAEFGWPLSDFIRCLIEEALRERFAELP
jgi:hypothetical protein